MTRNDRFETIAVKMNTTANPAGLKRCGGTGTDIVLGRVIYSAGFLWMKRISNHYATEQVMGTLFKVFCPGHHLYFIYPGLFGLISFVATRTKNVYPEVHRGGGLVNILNTSFVTMIFLANLIAPQYQPIFYQKWLSGYTYHRIECLAFCSYDVDFWVSP